MEAKEQRKILHIVCINVPPVASTPEMMGGGKRTEENPAYRVHQCSPCCINARNDGRRQKNRENPAYPVHQCSKNHPIHHCHKYRGTRMQLCASLSLMDIYVYPCATRRDDPLRHNTPQRHPWCSGARGCAQRVLHQHVVPMHWSAHGAKYLHRDAPLQQWCASRQ